MYQFKYQVDVFEIPGVELPLFVCTVPANWLALDLPTIGGRIVYFTSCERPTVFGDATFKFGEIDTSDKTMRKFSLNIQLDGKKCFEKPIVIQAQNSAQCEVVLLNHILGFASPSSWVAIDIADLISLLKMSSTYYFKYGVGAFPLDIFPDLVEPGIYRNIRCLYWMLFGNNQNMTLEHLHEVMLAMEATVFKYADEDWLGIAGMAGVEQDEMLISTLVGCQE